MLVPRFLLPNTWVSVQGFHGVIEIFLILVLVRFHFGTILAPNQMEPKDLVLKPKLTGTKTVQNLRYQNTEVAVLSVFSVLAQH